MIIAANSPGASRDGRHFVWASVGAVLIVFAGFAHSFFLRALFGKPALPLLLHVHGLVMTSWFVLFFAQTCLIAARRVDLHRRLGVFGAILAVLVVILDTVTAVHAAARGAHDPSARGQFLLALLGFSAIQLLVFASLVGSAIALRRRGDVHKRLMLLATLVLLPAAIVRIPLPFFQVNLTALLLTYLCVLGCVVVDTVRHSRLHPAFAWGAPLVIGSLHFAYIAMQTPAWIRIARSLVS